MAGGRVHPWMSCRLIAWVNESIWGFGTLLKGTLVVVRCPGTEPESTCSGLDVLHRTIQSIFMYPTKHTRTCSKGSWWKCVGKGVAELPELAGPG